jgi:hypothetical protein
MKCPYCNLFKNITYVCMVGGEIPSPWIDVRDALPEENGVYFVYDAEGSTGTAHFDGAWRGWKNVTHWMPLPAAPEGT